MSELLLRERIATLETEYSLSVTFPKNCQERIPLYELGHNFFNVLKSVMSGRKENHDSSKNRISLDFFIGNGARTYLDTGCHPEYSAPETKSVRDAVIYDKAGERLFSIISTILQKNLDEEGIAGEVRLHKNNSNQDISWGTHENYLFSRKVNWYNFIGAVVPFFVTRQIYSGAGSINHFTKRYEISDKARFIQEIQSSLTMDERAIINNRDEPHADRDSFRRYHHIAGESNMCEYATALKLGTTMVVLSLIEEAKLPVSLMNEMNEPVRTLKSVSEDIWLNNKYWFGRNKYTAVEIQRIYLDVANKHYGSISQELGDTYLDDIMKMWDFTLTALEWDTSSLVGKIDWITKNYLIEKKPGTNPVVIHFAYHRIYPIGVYDKLLRLAEDNSLNITIDRICTDEEIEYAINNPPQNTRAKTRGEMISGKGENINMGVNWNYISTRRYTDAGIVCDKLVSDDPREVDFRADFHEENNNPL